MTSLRLCLFSFSIVILSALSPAAAQSQQPAQAPAPVVEDKTAALAQLLNHYEEPQLLFALLAASPFSGNRSPKELVLLVNSVPVKQREKLKRDWFVFLRKRFSLEEIKQMRKWQLASPQGESLLLKMLAQVGLSDTEMLGQMMGLVPMNVTPQ